MKKIVHHLLELLNRGQAFCFPSYESTVEKGDGRERLGGQRIFIPTESWMAPEKRGNEVGGISSLVLLMRVDMHRMHEAILLTVGIHGPGLHMQLLSIWILLLALHRTSPFVMF
jgi:hypothetical protein